MALATFRMFLNDLPASDEQLGRFREIRVDQAIGVASEAELELDLQLDEQGNWSGVEEDFAQAFQRVRVEVKLGDGEFTALIDGPIVAQDIALGAGPGESQLTLVVHDDSVLLSRDEQVVLFEDMAAHEIAQSLISEAGLVPEVETVPASGARNGRSVVRRGTAMQLLRDLARRHGMFVYVRPGDQPGQSVCVFARPALQPGPAGELLLVGAERNIHRFDARFDALQPISARAGSVNIADKSLLTASAASSALDPLGAVAVHAGANAAGASLLARAREEQNDIDAAVAAAVDVSAFAYTATAELDANDYAWSLSPHQVVSVAGPGGLLGGHYLVSRVQHVIRDSGYTQSLTLRRNARSSGTAAAGSLAGGVF